MSGKLAIAGDGKKFPQHLDVLDLVAFAFRPSSVDSTTIIECVSASVDKSNQTVLWNHSSCTREAFLTIARTNIRD